jgi:hypothetical protein
MTTRDNSRVKRFPISGPILLDIFRTGRELHIKIGTGFPDDAIVVWRHYDHSTGMFYLTVQSETFEPVKEGEEIPFSVITITTLQNPPQQKEKNEDGQKGAHEATQQTGE